jgi:hypothetical protein
MSDLGAAYEHIARAWTREQLADRYRAATSRGAQESELDQDHLISRPISVLAAAIPACDALAIAIHVIHVLPDTTDPQLRDKLLGTAEVDSAIALHRCHRALELDGRANDYRAEDWLPAVCDGAAELLEGARLDCERPSIVETSQAAVRWLSRAIVDLDRVAHDATAAMVDGSAHILALHVFAASERKHGGHAGP